MKYLVLIIGGMCMSCASGPEIGPNEAANRHIDQGLVQAQRSASNITQVQTRVRLNPAPCDCPEHEVFLYEGWLRVYLTGPTSLLAALDRRIADAPLSMPLVSGRLTDGSRLTRNNVKFGVFEVEQASNQD